eukprot:CAMPEP_0203853344 /NCGR_PEP_ID=MMETSP0359-20131031/8482_1 /ASSEMBLY_ACC=CAM_ASM_000338 /TAXON_ID=268821 /ORGANISM="Scrippsiella Hangoei, Strain SHTV-5" /LENGTH=35 /DNA_ID= /DNA_START= /DNA_END= /DNA_ORIENTATION=
MQDKKHVSGGTGTLTDLSLGAQHVKSMPKPLRRKR